LTTFFDKINNFFNSRALRSLGCLSKTEGNHWVQSKRHRLWFSTNTCSCYSTKTHINSVILILKLNLTSLRNIYIKMCVVFITHTKSLKSVLQSFSQRWGSTDIKHTLYCGLGKEVGRALPSNKKAPNTSMKTQVVWLRRIKMKETYPAIKKQAPFMWRSYTCRPASLMASWT